MAAPLIAIIDDEPPVRTALAHFFAAAGFKVSTFGNGGEFLQWLREGMPDCAVLDLHMPGLTGYDVLKCLRGMASTLPVVVITGNDQPQTREKVMTAGAAAYLTKPIMGNVLLETVSNATGQARPEFSAGTLPFE